MEAKQRLIRDFRAKVDELQGLLQTYLSGESRTFGQGRTETTEDDKIVTGRIINLHGDIYEVNTNMLDPNGLVKVNTKNIVTMGPSKISMMPTGLLDVLHEDEVLDLLAYLLSRGDRTNKMFTR